MAAYNFQSRFVGPIKRRTKTQTIRRIGKRRHARPGEQVQLYIGMRTKKCKKIMTDPICLFAKPITIIIGPTGFFESISIDGAMLPRRHWSKFAAADGFASIDDFYQCFKSMHGVCKFRGVLIQWGRPRSTARHPVHVPQGSDRGELLRLPAYPRTLRRLDVCRAHAAKTLARAKRPRRTA